MVYGLLFLLLLLVLVVLRLYLILPRRANPTHSAARSQAGTCTLAVFLGSGKQREPHAWKDSKLRESLQVDIRARHSPCSLVSISTAIDLGSTLLVTATPLVPRKPSASNQTEPRVLCRTMSVAHPPSVLLALSLKLVCSIRFAATSMGVQEQYSIVTVPRARRVHQSLLTTPLSSARSLAVCIYHTTLQPLFSGKPFADVLVLNGPGTCVMLCLAVYFNKASLLYPISGDALHKNRDAALVYRTARS